MITVREFGTSGLVVLLLNGTGGALAHLERLAERLASTYRVLVPVFPGYADTPRHDGAYSFELDRSLLREALAARGACRIHAAIGHSFGASRAVALALADGFAVERIIGLGPALIVTPEERAGLMTLAGMLRQGVPLPLEAIVVGQLSNGWRAAHPEATQQLGEWLATANPHALADELEMVCRDLPFDAEHTLVRPAARVSKLLFRVGSANLSAPSERVRGLAERVGADIQIVEGAAHLLLVEDFEATAAAVARALAEPPLAKGIDGALG